MADSTSAPVMALATAAQSATSPTIGTQGVVHGMDGGQGVHHGPQGVHHGPQGVNHGPSHAASVVGANNAARSMLSLIHI